MRKSRITGRHWAVLQPAFAHVPLSGAGAAKRGGRFNPQGIEALYLSEDLATAIAEHHKHDDTRPGTFVAVDVEADGIVDLGDEVVRTAVDISEADLACSWETMMEAGSGAGPGHEPPTWALARRLISQGCTGLRVRSARRPEGFNLVLWRLEGPATRLRVLDDNRDLPRDQSSWPDETG